MQNFHEIEDIVTVPDLAQLFLCNYFCATAKVGSLLPSWVQTYASWKPASKLGAKWQKLEDSQRKFVSIINDIYVTLYRIIIYLYERYKKKYKIHHRHRSQNDYSNNRHSKRQLSRKERRQTQRRTSLQRTRNLYERRAERVY